MDFSLTPTLDTKRKIKQAIMSWLSPLEMGQVHQTISEKPSEGSGQWFLQSEAFRDWEDGKDMLLWCSGIRKFVCNSDMNV